MAQHEEHASGHGWDRDEDRPDEGWAGPPWGARRGGPGAQWFAGPGGPGMWGGAARWGRGGGRPWGRARRGDIRGAVLVLLNERPMHGYEIIGELAQRTDGLWRPSPGSIYPTLQLLEDEGLVALHVDDGSGKKRYALTEEGARSAEALASGPAPWDQMKDGAPPGAIALHQALRRLLPAVRQIGMTGDGQEHAEAVKVLEEARKRLYAVLAGSTQHQGGAEKAAE